MNNPLKALIDGKRIMSEVIHDNTVLTRDSCDKLADTIISKLLDINVYLVEDTASNTEESNNG